MYYWKIHIPTSNSNEIGKVKWISISNGFVQNFVEYEVFKSPFFKKYHNPEPKMMLKYREVQCTLTRQLVMLFFHHEQAVNKLEDA